MAETKLVALIGADPVVAEVLSQLLRGIGYTSKSLTLSAVCVKGSLDGVHLLLLAPGLQIASREAALTNFASAPDTATIPVLELISDLTQIRNVQGQIIPWPCRIEELKRRIEGTLQGATVPNSRNS